MALVQTPPRPAATAAPAAPAVQASGPDAIEVRRLNFYYGTTRALENITLGIRPHVVTAFIGPSGCGKSTFLRTLNRMNDIIAGTRVEGQVLIEGRRTSTRRAATSSRSAPRGHGVPEVEPVPEVDLRQRGLRAADQRVVLQPWRSAGSGRREPRRAALWEEVKDRLHESALALSGGQQQRLCIARALAIRPEILLMDEPASALDPIATQRIEELIYQLKANYTIVIVTHSMQQAARVSDRTAFFWLGRLVEYGATDQMFTNPREKLTEDYVTGRFG
jgi:phosphate transport system ATP-binding protein